MSPVINQRHSNIITHRAEMSRRTQSGMAAARKTRLADSNFQFPGDKSFRSHNQNNVWAKQVNGQMVPASLVPSFLAPSASSCQHAAHIINNTVCFAARQPSSVVVAVVASGDTVITRSIRRDGTATSSHLQPSSLLPVFHAGLGPA